MNTELNKTRSTKNDINHPSHSYLKQVNDPLPKIYRVNNSSTLSTPIDKATEDNGDVNQMYCKGYN